MPDSDEVAKVLASRVAPHLDKSHDLGWAGCVLAAQEMVKMSDNARLKAVWGLLIDQMIEAGRHVCEDFDGAMEHVREDFAEVKRDA